MVGMVSVLTWQYLELGKDLPSLDLLPALVDGAGSQLRQPTRLYDRSGEQVLLTLQDPKAAGNRYLLLEAFPPALITATLTTADPDFWSHAGYTFGDRPPSLAQQLVTDLLLWGENPSPQREWRSRILAAQATQRYGRKKILEWVLNHQPYGPDVYGADAAARAYLGKSATELTLAEAAFIVAASERPAIHPVSAAELTIQRQTEILLEMRARGLVTAEMLFQASQEILPLQTPAEPVSMAPAFTRLVLRQLATQFSTERLRRGGVKVVTTLDLDLQTQTACTLRTQLARIQNTTPPDCDAARLLPTLAGMQQDADTPPELDASALILDPKNGQVLAFVGEEKSETSGGAITGEHPAGSALTPFVYLTAFARGFSPASLAWDIPDDRLGIENFGQVYHGPVRFRVALANDYLVPAAQTYEQVGSLDVWRTLAQFGVARPGEMAGEDFASFLDTPIDLLTAAHALSAFANHGTLTGQALDTTSQLHAASVLYAESVDGRTWLDWHATQHRPVLGAQLAYLENHVLSDETARWPSLGHPNPLEIGRPAAVKLSQTLEGNDTWAIGAVPQRMIGVWIGRPAGENATDRLSPNAAAAVWHALMQYAVRDLPVERWDVPAGIVTQAVCDPSGLLPTLECPNVVNEVFIDGNQPTRLDDLYRSVPVNRVNGLLATIFTPPSLIEERVYINVPSQAIPWAKEAQFAIPPSVYDIISLPATNRDVQITSPANFEPVSGVIEFHGTAAGDDFASYRLLAGAGLNPQRWIEIGGEGMRPIRSGLLGTWDTAGLSGLYAIQLQVVREDAQIETHILQLSIDNRPPETKVLLSEMALRAQDGYVLLQVDARDDLSLQRIEFKLDRKLIGALYPQTGEYGPFTLAWKIAPGQHHLQVTSFDRAGNSSQDEETFNVP